MDIKKLVHKIFSRADDGDIAKMRKDVYVGRQLAEFIVSEPFKLFEDEILGPLYAGAFEAFKKIDPKNTEEVIQAQMMPKMIDQIRREVDIRIRQGELAQIHLQEQEGESNE